MVNKIMLIIRGFIFVSMIGVVLSCQNEQIEPSFKEINILKSVSPPTFNWETVDWMPTPNGQQQISVPWIGQGSIASIYPPDVVNDYKKIDGWEMIYNTFDANSQGPLVNPYFMLYNKYRGILRIYLYTTTQFVLPSTYLQDGINIISNKQSNILNFLGNDIVDISQNKNIYSQMQPKPLDGSLPLASNKWYMLQYELAYDPSIKTLNNDEMKLSWFTNFYGVTDAKFHGEINGSITGSIGSSQGNNFFSALGNLGKVSGEIVLSALGSNFIEKNTINSYYGTNHLKLPTNIFKNMTKGINSALSAATSNLPGSIVNVFSGIVGGSSAGQTVNLKFNADITLNGELTNHGSFPSSPTVVYLPGTNIPSSAQGYIPLYNKPLGVYYLNAKPKIGKKRTIEVEREGSPREGFTMITTYIDKIIKYNNSDKLIINEEVLKYASVELVDEDVVFIRLGNNGIVWSSNGTKEEIGRYSEVYVNSSEISFRGTPTFIPAIRMTIKVTPKNGQPSSLLINTFLAEIEDL